MEIDTTNGIFLNVRTTDRKSKNWKKVLKQLDKSGPIWHQQFANEVVSRYESDMYRVKVLTEKPVISITYECLMREDNAEITYHSHTKDTIRFHMNGNFKTVGAEIVIDNIVDVIVSNYCVKRDSLLASLEIPVCLC